jgi:putative membrane protein
MIASKHVFGAAMLALLFSASTVHAQGAAGSSAGTAGGAGASSSAPGKSGAADKSGAASKDSSGKVSKTDEKMMRDLAYANIAEVETGKLAQSKSKNEDVRAFAQRMVDDHGKAMSELQQLAQSKGVTLPTEPDSKHKAAAEKLSKLNGAAFDGAYMKQVGVNDHSDTHKLLERVKSKATDPELKAMGDKMLPVVDEHLAMAKKPRGKSSGGGAEKSGSSGGAGSSEKNQGAAAPTGK